MMFSAASPRWQKNKEDLVWKRKKHFQGKKKKFLPEFAYIYNLVSDIRTKTQTFLKNIGEILFLRMSCEKMIY